MSVLIPGTCRRTEPQCSSVGVARCVTCKAWYCSTQCQEAHWPRHWRECLPLPDLEWLTQDDKTQKTVFVKKDPSTQTASSGNSSDQGQVVLGLLDLRSFRAVLQPGPFPQRNPQRQRQTRRLIFVAQTAPCRARHPAPLSLSRHNLRAQQPKIRQCQCLCRPVHLR